MQSNYRLNEITQRTESFLALASKADKIVTQDIRERIKEILVSSFKEKEKEFLAQIKSIINNLASFWRFSENPNHRLAGEIAARKEEEATMKKNVFEKNFNLALEKLESMTAANLLEILNTLHNDGLDQTIDHLIGPTGWHILTYGGKTKSGKDLPPEFRISIFKLGIVQPILMPSKTTI